MINLQLDILADIDGGRPRDRDWSFHPPLVALGKVNLGLCEVKVRVGLRWRRKRQNVWLAYDRDGVAWDPITKARYVDLDGW